LSSDATDLRDLAQQVATLRELVEALARDNEILHAELAKGEPHDAPVKWVALKAANRGNFSYEAARSWCEAGLTEAKKERGRWYVNQASLSAYLARLAPP
jgi:hypothetical protein